MVLLWTRWFCLFLRSCMWYLTLIFVNPGKYRCSWFSGFGWSPGKTCSLLCLSAALSSQDILRSSLIGQTVSVCLCLQGHPGPAGGPGFPGLDGCNGTKGDRGEPGYPGEYGRNGELVRHQNKWRVNSAETRSHRRKLPQEPLEELCGSTVVLLQFCCSSAVILLNFYCRCLSVCVLKSFRDLLILNIQVSSAVFQTSKYTVYCSRFSVVSPW